MAEYQRNLLKNNRFFIFSTKKGICCYAQTHSDFQADFAQFRFKLPSGKIVIMSQDFILQNYTSDYISNSYIYSDNVQVFIDKNGKMYIFTMFKNADNNHFSFAILRIDLGDNQLQYTKVVEKEVPNTIVHSPVVGELLVNPKRGVVMCGFYDSYDNIVGILEFDGSNIQYIFTENDFRFITNFTSNYLINTYNSRALNLNNYQETNIQTDSRYDVREYSFSRYSDYYSCKALEYETGRIGIIECSVTGGILGFTPIDDGENITLSRIN
ncbi:MAG: hypothetical protein FWH23_02265 [Bacteroidales bacterium]|nr:hypothetical protein [Bacteroidales bacterium]MCL2132987.1 hypothetical protein [Bacteroidales bacterium]